MKKIFVSLFVLLLAASSARAQLVRRPLLTQFIQGPLVHDLVNLGLSQVPGMPSLPNVTRDNSRILVDSAVPGNIGRATTNLNDADAIMKKLLESNKTALDAAVDPKVDPKVNPATTAPKTTRVDELAKLLLKTSDEKLRNEIQGQLYTELKKGVDLEEKATKFQAQMDKGLKAMVNEDFSAAQTAFREALNINKGDPVAIHYLLQAGSEKRAADIAKSLDALIAKLNNNPAEPAPMDEAKLDLKINKPNKDDVVQINKKGTTKVAIELAENAPATLTLKASVMELPGISSLTGTGTIKAGEKKGVVTITTTVIPTVTPFEITLTIDSTAKTKSATFKIKATMIE